MFPANVRAAARWNPAAADRVSAIESRRRSSSRSIAKQDSIAMPRENDLEGAQDQGGKHGGQKGMPTPEPEPPRGPDQGHRARRKGTGAAARQGACPAGSSHG